MTINTVIREEQGGLKTRRETLTLWKTLNDLLDYPGCQFNGNLGINTF